MDDVPSCPPALTSRLFGSSPTASPLVFDAVAFASQTHLLDLYATTDISSHHGLTHHSPNQSIEALSKKLSVQSLKHQDTHPSPRLRGDSRWTSAVRGHQTRRGTDEEDTLTEPRTRDTINARGHPLLASTPPVDDESQGGLHSPIIEADELPLAAMPIDEGYCHDEVDHMWMDLSDLTAMDPHIGGPMGHIMHVRSSARAALDCSKLVQRAPRMRKRKHRAHESVIATTLSPHNHHDGHDLKRARCV